MKLTLEPGQLDSTFCLPNHHVALPKLNWVRLDARYHQVGFLHFQMSNREVQALKMAAPGPELQAPNSQTTGTFSWLSLKVRPRWGLCVPCLVLQMVFTQLGVGSARLPVCCLQSKCHPGSTGLYPQPRNGNGDRKEHSFAGFRHLDLSFQFLPNKMQITESGGCLRSVPS